MFRTYNVADSFGHMNLFMTLQVYRNLSTLTYLNAGKSAEDESDRDERKEPVKTDRELAAQ